MGYRGLKAGVTGASCELDSRLSQQPEQGCESRRSGVMLGEMVREPLEGEGGNRTGKGGWDPGHIGHECSGTAGL